MPTLITKHYGAGRDYENGYFLGQYLGTLDLVASDLNVEIIFHESMTTIWGLGVQNWDDTHRVKLKPAPGLSVNDLNKTTLNSASTGIYCAFSDSSNTLVDVSGGIDFYDMRVDVKGTNGWRMRLKGHRGTIDNKFFNCRITDTGTSSSPAIMCGEDSNTSYFESCLFATDAGNDMHALATRGGAVKAQGSIFAARGAAVGNAKAIFGGAFTVENSTFIGYGETICGTGVTVTNCFSNTTPTAGVTTGFTVVTAAGGLVMNEANNYLQAAGSPTIGAATSALDNTTDMFGQFRGSNPDVSPVMKVAAAVPAAPNATITGIQVVGQRVIVTGTSSAVINSGVATLTAVSGSAVTKSGNFSFVGQNWTAEFFPCNPGGYAIPSVILTNTGDTGTCSGGDPVTVAVPAAPVVTITSQSKTTSSITVSGTVTGYPTSGTLSVDGPTDVQVPLVISDAGTFTATASGLSVGTNTPTVSATNFTATDTETGTPTTLYAPGAQPPGLPAVELAPYSAPDFNAPSIANGGTITTLTIENTNASTKTNEPFSIAHGFKQGQLKMSDSLIGKIAGQSDIVLQFDPKATWPDGSVSHGLISGIIPSIAGSSELTIQMVRSTAARDNTPVSPATVAASGINAMATAVIGGVTYTASANEVLNSGVGLKTWRAGPIATEYLFEAPFKASNGTPYPGLWAQFEVRYYSSLGRGRASVTVENGDYGYVNDEDYVAQQVDITGAFNITVAGNTIYTNAALAHWAARRWRRIGWLGAASALHVKFNVPYLLDSKWVPNYDRSLVIPESVLSTYVRADYYDGPMQAGNNFSQMSATGAHSEIGIHPEWMTIWLLSQDKRAKKVCLVNAEAGGSFGVHLRVRKAGPTYGQPVDPVHYPYAGSGNANDMWNPNTGKNESKNINSAGATTQHDGAHQPAFAIVPYLLTGDYFYLEETLFWAAENAASGHPGYRLRERGLFIHDQTRGQGWSIRTAGYIAAMLPDDHVQKPIANYILDSNLSWYNENYTNDVSAPGKALGLVHNGAVDSDGPHVRKFWMDDFITQSVGAVADLGFPKAEAFLQWKARLPVGRLLDPGWCWMMAAAYAIQYRAGENAAPYSTFEEMFQATYANNPVLLNAPCNSQEMADEWGSSGPGDMGGLPSYIMGYPANMQPAVAYAADSGYPDADLAWDLFDSRTVKPDYREGAQFAIVPRSVAVEEPGGEEPVPTVTSVTVSPSTANLAGGATQQFTRTVTGANSPSQNGTWSANLGSVNTSGLYTAPSASNAEQVAVVTFTSEVNPSKTGSATVTIAAIPNVPAPAFTVTRRGRSRSRARR